MHWSGDLSLAKTYDGSSVENVIETIVVSWI